MLITSAFRSVTFQSLIFSIFISLVLTSCGGGSGSTPPPLSTNTMTAEGVYSGSTSNGSSFDFDSVVLEDGSYYILYGMRSAGMMTVLGFVQGNGTSNNGSFASANMKDFTAAGTVLSGSLSATYSTGSLNGTVTEGSITSPFKGTTPVNSSYAYNVGANLADIKGAWTLTNMKGGATVAMNIAANGTFTASSAGCIATGSFTPRASGKNIFNLATTFGAAPCALPGQTATGIAIDFLLANGSHQLVAAGSNILGTDGTAYFGVSSGTNTTYTIGGSTAGLTGTVVLQDNGGDNLTISANGAFTFATQIANGSPYNVSVLTQPSGQTCSVSTGAGTVSSANITGVAVICSNNSYTIGGSTAGLTGTVVLQDNGGDNLTISANGAFTFATQIANGSPYNVSVLTQPSGQTCSVSTGAGTVKSANVTGVIITCSTNSTAGYIYTVAGTGSLGYSGDSGAATSAQIYYPNSVAVDSTGNLYIADSANNRIRKVATDGVITSVAGTGSAGFSGDGGAATSAQLSYPYCIAVDSTGNLYFGDANNYVIRKVAVSGIITTVAGSGTLGFSGDGGLATSAKINLPTGVAVDTSGNLYIADSANNRIRKVATDGVITTVAGTGTLGYSGDNGPATSANLNYPELLAVDAAGNIYFPDTYNNVIRKVATNGTITTVAGIGSGFAGDGGLATSASLNVPTGVAVDSTGNLYIADYNNKRIRIVTTNGIISTVAGTGTSGFSGDNGTATSAMLNAATGVAVDNAGNLYIADTSNNRIRKVTK